jgi:hypothetical protein
MVSVKPLSTAGFADSSVPIDYSWGPFCIANNPRDLPDFCTIPPSVAPSFGSRRGVPLAGCKWGEISLDSWRRVAGRGAHGAGLAIDLGNEPPLGLDGDVEETIDRRRVSIRWLAATVLVALAGGGLMGGAVWAALDGEYRFATLPEIAPSFCAADDRTQAPPRKTDRISLFADTISARQTIRVSTSTRQGEREIVRVRPYIRVATTWCSRLRRFRDRASLQSAKAHRRSGHGTGAGAADRIDR